MERLASCCTTNSTLIVSTTPWRDQEPTILSDMVLCEFKVAIHPSKTSSRTSTRLRIMALHPRTNMVRLIPDHGLQDPPEADTFRKNVVQLEWTSVLRVLEDLVRGRACSHIFIIADCEL